ncbi:SixA phosphatase family protein [Faecalibacter bovis]|uniref:Histidine phosphatase family protein n=1 Tax=Faecalibacter bovis TaxID=2898187 RepID=A0ABX7XAS6_9FLAO|nr:histidine phosphatase family protein [Faecalibacter bovis]QTV04978.1 histidine phosphatase family protein [Faecalibacter bovis]
MKKLILFRHGKSRWDEGLSDQFRSLNEKGIERTNLSANKLAEILDFEPQHVFSSTATRAKETAEITKKIVFPKIEIQFDSELYTFSHFNLKNWIKSTDNALDHLIIFGHNPAFTDIAYDLGSEFILNIPTSGVVWIEFMTDNWNDIIRGTTKHVILPKEL